MARAAAVAARVDVGEAEDLTRARVDKDLDRFLGEGDAAFEQGAGFENIGEIGELGRVLAERGEFSHEPAPQAGSSARQRRAGGGRAREPGTA